MSDNYWDATIEAFEGFITKPKLEEKLLKRPPFLFILHIYLETMKNSEHGFGKHLFTADQLSRKYYDPKMSPDATKQEINTRKEHFFIKLIKLLSIVLKEPKSANPINIIKGKECDKTNVFLQSLAKAARLGKDCSGPEKKLLEMFNKKFGGGKKEEPKEDAKPKDEPRQEPPRRRSPSPQRGGAAEDEPIQQRNEPQSRFQRNVEDQIN